MADVETGELRVSTVTSSSGPSVSFALPTVDHEEQHDDTKSQESTQVPSRRTKKSRPSFLVRHTNDRSMIRSRRVMDSETGRSGMILECSIQDVTTHQLVPQDPRKRFRKKIWSRMNVAALVESNELTASEEEEAPPKQYRFRSKRKVGWCENIMGVDDDDEALYNSSWTVASFVTGYLNWTFRVSFKRLLLNFFVSFWVATIFWSLLILGIAELRPECMQVGEVAPDSTNTHLWIDAYTLSWTTFSTVGYGLIHPQVTSAAFEGGTTRCVGMNLLMALEAFCGVLFTAVCGAIIFSKLTRFQRNARVVFSSPLIFKYGSGLRTSNDTTDEPEEDDIPFPIVEFRVVNQNRNGGGEVLNARVKCVASVNVEEASEAVLLAAGVRGNKKKKMDGTLFHKEMQAALKSPQVVARAGIDGLHYLKGTLNKAINFQTPRFSLKNPPSASMREIKSNVTSLATKPSSASMHAMKTGSGLDSKKEEAPDTEKDVNQTSNQRNIVREYLYIATSKRKLCLIDAGSDLMPKQIFSPLELLIDSHPSFKRVWILRHELNGQSPLLGGKARQMTAENGGKWPEELNNYKSIRQNIHFVEIVCSFTGTSNATGSTVYKQHIYDFSNVNIGYRFANLLHIDRTGVLQVDETLLNDVLEQRGGGGEPFGNLRSNVVTEALDAFKMAAEHTAGPGIEKLKSAAESTAGPGLRRFKTAVGRAASAANLGFEKAEGVAVHVKDDIVHAGDAVVDKMKPLVGIHEGDECGEMGQDEEEGATAANAKKTE
jgi:hypothetical protein